MKNHTKKILIYCIPYKTLIGSKVWRIRFKKVARYLTFFCSKNYDPIYDRIAYFVSLKINSTYIFSHYFEKIMVNSYGPLTIEKTLTFYNVII